MVPVPHCTPAYHGEGTTQVLRPLQGGSAAPLGESKNGKREAEETSPGLVAQHIWKPHREGLLSSPWDTSPVSPDLGLMSSDVPSANRMAQGLP